MDPETFYELYQLISDGISEIPSRKQTMLLRKAGLTTYVLDCGFSKVAFDTRRVNQETEYIPRRGLQNYHRSEQFISDGLNNKIQAFARLNEVLEKLKAQYGRSSDWQDSYIRVLSSAVNKGLRIEQADGDYSEVQPSVASLDYLTELIDVRYRLNVDDLISMSEEDLTNRILSKDHFLVSDAVLNNDIIKPSDVSKYSYDHMMDKMMTTMAQVMSSYKPPSPEDNLTNKLFDIRATQDNPEIERTVTITIKDKIVKETLQKSSQLIVDNIKTSDDEIIVE